MIGPVLGRRLRRFGVVAFLLSVAAGVTAAVVAPQPPPHTAAANEGTVGGLTLTAKVFTSGGWVPPGGAFPMVLTYKAGAAPTAAATISVTLHGASVFVTSTPAPISGNGTSGSPLVYSVPVLAAEQAGKIIIEARGKSLAEDPEVIWKDISAAVSLAVTGVSSPLQLRTHGPKVTTLTSARYGDRPFPAVMVQYQDVKHCDGVDSPYPEFCTGDHNAARFDEAINSKTSGNSLWRLYQDMSFGQLYPIGTVSPPVGSTTVPFTPGYVHKFSTLQPNGTCSGTTVAAAYGTPAYGNRIEKGWYLLPGTQAYYGSDSAGWRVPSAVVGVPAGGIDDGCGPTAKIVYDAASLADADIDYNDYDTDKDGVVDFFNLMFAGCGGHGCTEPTGPNNIWPHKSDVRYYFKDEATGVTGYISNDVLKDHYGRPLYYVDARRKAFTTTNTGIPAYVVVGPYNVNPEDAVDHVSVVGHEYGHSLGLPDFYAYAYDAFGAWELMGTDYFQYMASYARQVMGWVVPRTLKDGTVTLRESKYDTGEIHWTRPDGEPYVLTGPGIHNADVYRLDLPTELLIDKVPSGSHAWFSGSGNDFGCAPEAGHNLDIVLPDLKNYDSASAITLTFQSKYEIEWDWDYAFVMVSKDNGDTWKTLPSQNGTTISNAYNPNNVECFKGHNNGITGVFQGGGNTLANPNRAQNRYPAYTGAEHGFVLDRFDLTPYKGDSILLRFSYFTDPAAVNRGWFIDDIKITADDAVVYESDFESGHEADRLFPERWLRASTSQGADIEHAYFLELRDRINNDFDGKLQSERGTPSWEPGVLLIYSDRLHGFGNTAAADHPAQTPVDANPQPGSTSPNLNDAAFNLTRPTFDGCTHIDNYEDPDGPDDQWKLPENLKFTVTSISGLSSGGAIPGAPATATLLAEVNPDCDLVVAPPTLAIDSGYEDPDTNGAYRLAWTRPAGASGPDVLQEATVYSVLLDDAAESGLGKWVTVGQGSGSFAWEVSSVKSRDGSSFWGRYANGSDAQGVSRPASLLTLKDPITVPADGDTTLTYWDFFMNEGDDLVVLEATRDNGATWETITQGSRSALAPDAAPLIAEEPLTKRVFPLDAFKGASIKLRFRVQSGGEDRAGSAPFGWYVDDIRVENSNFADVLTTANTVADITGRAIGNYHYRVRTTYTTGAGALPSGWSEIVSLEVAQAGTAPPPPTGGGSQPATTAVEGNNRVGGSVSLWVVAMLGLAGLGRRRRV